MRKETWGKIQEQVGTKSEQGRKIDGYRKTGGTLRYFVENIEVPLAQDHGTSVQSEDKESTCDETGAPKGTRV